MNRTNSRKFLAVAASARALARSIAQAGEQCHAVDLFADWDTRQLCSVVQANSMDETVSIASGLELEASLVLGGGLENHADSLQELTGRFPICGTTIDGLRKSRDPFWLENVLRNAGLETLRLSKSTPDLTVVDTNEWVAKPLHSAGGQRVCRVAELSDGFVTDGFYFQQYAVGPVFGASFLASQNQCFLTGIARQIVEPLAGDEFAYHGSIGPLPIGQLPVMLLRKMGRVVAETCGLCGWFGIDVALVNDVPMLLEVNPRYTASMELVERACARSLFPFHLAAVNNEPMEAIENLVPANSWITGKYYVFNRTERVLEVEQPAFEKLSWVSQQSAALITDVPVRGTRIQPGHPICTVWSRGPDEETVRGLLDELSNDVLRTVL